MEIKDINSFLAYYEKIRGRTLKIIQCIPPAKLEWTYKEGKFTIGDLVRHIATIERYMYVETVRGKQSGYPGCGAELANGLENVVNYFNQLHKESVEILKSLNNEDLQKKCMTPEGSPITTWKWLRAMIEHEIHHRGQIYLYLNLLEIKTPPLFGLTAEEVFEKSQHTGAGTNP